jgi:hypothetical protein
MFKISIKTTYDLCNGYSVSSVRKKLNFLKHYLTNFWHQREIFTTAGVQKAASLACNTTQLEPEYHAILETMWQHLWWPVLYKCLIWMKRSSLTQLQNNFRDMCVCMYSICSILCLKTSPCMWHKKLTKQLTRFSWNLKLQSSTNIIKMHYNFVVIKG